jgi:hypothetical protein
MYRFLATLLLLLPALIAPAFADDPPKEPQAPTANHVRLRWEEHFAQANAAHDGHLTLDEAKAGYHTVARHFRDIDVDSKGYVTEADVRAWHALQKAGHEHGKDSQDALRPRNAFQQRAYTEQHTVNTSTDQTVALPREAPAADAPDRP